MLSEIITLFHSRLGLSVDTLKNASNWTKIGPSDQTPTVRSGHSSVVVGETMYVFGGYNEGNCYNDFFAFDLIRHQWKRIESEIGIVPDGRASHACCASSDKSKLYLFGGSGPHWGHTNMSKLLQFNIKEQNWTIVETAGAQPPPGYGQSLCAINSKLYLFGGTSGHEYVNDLYVFNEDTLTWNKAETRGCRPSPRYKHQVSCVGSRMYAVGGGLRDPLKMPIDTSYLDVDTLTWHEMQCSGEIPRARIAHTLVQSTCDPNVLVMFGGRDESGTCCNEMSEVNVVTGEWMIYEEEEGCQPDARDFHTAVMYDDQMFVFGGFNGVKRNNEMYCCTLPSSTGEPNK